MCRVAGRSIAGRESTSGCRRRAGVPSCVGRGRTVVSGSDGGGLGPLPARGVRRVPGFAHVTTCDQRGASALAGWATVV